MKRIGQKQFQSMQEEGRISASCVLVNDHVLDMPNRIRAEMGDDRYFVCFNRESGKWEIHYDGKSFNTLEVVVPFTALDQRAINYLNKTRSVNAEKIVRDTLIHNEQLKQARTKKDKDLIGAIARDAYRFKDHNPGKTLSADELKQAVLSAM